MNSLSKVTLLVTLLTAPVAGFAMEAGDFPNDFGKSVEQTTQAATAATKGVIALAQENPAIATGVAVATVVTLYGVKKLSGWMFGKPANASVVAKNEVAVAIAKGKITVAQLTEWAKQESKLKTKLADNGLTMDQYQAWVKTQAK